MERQNKMPYKNKKKYTDYMKKYMRDQRKQAQTLKRQMLKDSKKMEQLQKQFPDAYKLLFGKKRRK